VRTVGNLAVSKAPWEPRLRSALCRARVAAESRFATVAILTLALGIGGTTAIFSVVDPVQMRPLPYAEPERLVSISMRLPSVKLETLTSGDFVQFEWESDVFECMAAYPHSLADDEASSGGRAVSRRGGEGHAEFLSDPGEDHHFRGAIGSVLAFAGLKMVAHVLPADIPQIDQVQ